MDIVSNKAIIIGVSIFVTLAIASAIFIVVNQLKEVYKTSDEVNISIHNELSEYNMYDRTELTGVDLVNTVKKYVDNDRVRIVFNGSLIANKENFIILNGDYSDLDYTSQLYNVTYDKDEYDVVTINFEYKI